MKRRAGSKVNRESGERRERKKRRAAHRRGLMAERLCALFLRLKGYRILATRFRVRSGEVDLVARRGNLLVGIEVKARPDLQAGLEAPGPRQWERIRRAMEAFRARRPDLAGCGIRYDVMVVRPWRVPYHLADVWR